MAINPLVMLPLEDPKWLEFQGVGGNPGKKDELSDQDDEGPRCLEDMPKVPINTRDVRTAVLTLLDAEQALRSDGQPPRTKLERDLQRDLSQMLKKS